MHIDYGRMRGAARRMAVLRETVLDELPFDHPDTGDSSAETSAGLDRVAGACRQLEEDLARISTGVVDTCDDFWRTDDLLVGPDFLCLPAQGAPPEGAPPEGSGR